MIKTFFALFTSLVLVSALHAQTQLASTQAPLNTARPRLVVGIVVDQMRYDYVYRFWDKYGNEGLKKLATRGAFCTNTHYNYVPTETGPGHSAIYTGTVPSVHGIVGNEWYSRAEEQKVYCVDDKKCHTIGADGKSGRMSPSRLLVSTITDELRLGTNMNSKVIGIALKDRASILPAGHLANAAFWYDDKSGDFVSSSYYNFPKDQLPEWLTKFNSRKLADSFLNLGWNTLKPITSYTESMADSNSYEIGFGRTGKPTFPYNFTEARSVRGLGVLRNTPYGNCITTNLAMSVLEGEQMGMHNQTDFLCISYSSTDAIGHQFGPYSKEIEDCYIRFDLEIARLLNYLEKKYGKDNVLIFLTADHAVADVPQHSIDLNLPAGYIKGKQVEDSIKKLLWTNVQDSTLLLGLYDQQIYLKHSNIEESKIRKAKDVIRNYLLTVPGVQDVSTYSTPFSNTTLPFDKYLANGVMPSRCGDIFIKYQPGWFVSERKAGTSHGSPYNYDTHVPLIWYGYGIAPKRIARETYITDIAPTLAQFLKIQEPNGSIGNVIEEIVK